MAKQTEYTEYQELFDLILDVDNGMVTSLELIKYLSNLDALMKSINHTLNRQYGIGFDQVELNIIALEKGSFKVSAFLKKLSANPYTLATFTAIISAIATNLLSDKKENIVYNINNSNVEIKYGIVVENKESVRAISNIAKTTVDSREIKGLAIEYGIEQNKKQRVDITKSTLRELIVEDLDTPDKESHIMSNARLVIVSPVLESEQATWKFKFNDRKLSARMMDEGFLKLMDEKKIAFGKGDVIVADLETIVTKKSDDTPDVKHYVRKVHQYPQYTTKVNQRDLFLSNVE